MCAAYMSSPCHIELILTEKDATVKADKVRFFACKGYWCVCRAKFGFVPCLPICLYPLACIALQDGDKKEPKVSRKQLAIQMRSGAISKKA